MQTHQTFSLILRVQRTRIDYDLSETKLISGQNSCLEAVKFYKESIEDWWIIASGVEITHLAAHQDQFIIASSLADDSSNPEHKNRDPEVWMHQIQKNYIRKDFLFKHEWLATKGLMIIWFEDRQKNQKNPLQGEPLIDFVSAWHRQFLCGRTSGNPAKFLRTKLVSSRKLLSI